MNLKKHYATATGLYEEEDFNGPPPMPYTIVYRAKEVDELVTKENMEILIAYMVSGQDINDTIKRLVDLKKWPDNK
jgi:hypothetical protein